jgi:hypothetical protein
MTPPDESGPPTAPPVTTRVSEGAGLDKMGCLAFIGLMLVHTVVGAVIGIPILIVCMAVFFVRAIRRHRARTVSGMCPWCEEDIAIDGSPESFVCHACRNPLTLAEGAFRQGTEAVGA